MPKSTAQFSSPREIAPTPREITSTPRGNAPSKMRTSRNDTKLSSSLLPSYLQSSKQFLQDFVHKTPNKGAYEGNKERLSNIRQENSLISSRSAPSLLPKVYDSTTSVENGEEQSLGHSSSRSRFSSPTMRKFSVAESEASTKSARGTSTRPRVYRKNSRDNLDVKHIIIAGQNANACIPAAGSIGSADSKLKVVIPPPQGDNPKEKKLEKVSLKNSWKRHLMKMETMEFLDDDGEKEAKEISTLKKLLKSPDASSTIATVAVDLLKKSRSPTGGGFAKSLVPSPVSSPVSSPMSSVPNSNSLFGVKDRTFDGTRSLPGSSTSSPMRGHFGHFGQFPGKHDGNERKSSLGVQRIAKQEFKANTEAQAAVLRKVKENERMLSDVRRLRKYFDELVVRSNTGYNTVTMDVLEKEIGKGCLTSLRRAMNDPDSVTFENFLVIYYPEEPTYRIKRMVRSTLPKKPPPPPPPKPDAEIVSELNKLWSQWDDDGSGELDRREFQTALQSLGVTDKDHFDDIFNEIDTTMNESIDKTEFMAWYILGDSRESDRIGPILKDLEMKEGML